MRMPKDKLTELKGADRLGAKRDSEYLGAEDIDEGAEPILTIAKLLNGEVKLQRGRENKDVIVFAENSVRGIRHVRPLIVNVTNRRTLRKLYGSVTADALIGKTIQLYVDHNVRDPNDGTMTDGIRIKNFKPSEESELTVKCTGCGADITDKGGMTAAQIISRANKKYHTPFCYDCMIELKKSEDAAKAEAAETGTPVEKEVNPEC